MASTPGLLSLLLYFVGVINAFLAASLGWYKRLDAASYTLAWAVYAFALALLPPSLLKPQTTFPAGLLLLSLTAMGVSWWYVWKQRLQVAAFWLGWATFAVLAAWAWQAVL